MASEQKGLNVYQKLKGIFVSPGSFFASVTSESVWESAVFYASFALLYVFLVYLFDPVFHLLYSGLVFFGILPDIGPYIVTALWIFLLIFLALVSALVHVFVKIAGGNKGFGETFKSLAYGTVPGFAFGWLPFVGLVFFLWPVYLYVNGLKTMHGLSNTRAWFALLMPVFLFLLITSVVSLWIISSLFSAWGMSLLGTPDLLSMNTLLYG